MPFDRVVGEIASRIPGGRGGGMFMPIVMGGGGGGGGGEGSGDGAAGKSLTPLHSVHAVFLINPLYPSRRSPHVSIL